MRKQIERPIQSISRGGTHWPSSGRTSAPLMQPMCSKSAALPAEAGSARCVWKRRSARVRRLLPAAGVAHRSCGANASGSAASGPASLPGNSGQRVFPARCLARKVLLPGGDSFLQRFMSRSAYGFSRRETQDANRTRRAAGVAVCGELAGARTQDPCIKSAMLYQLSYELTLSRQILVYQSECVGEAIRDFQIEPMNCRLGPRGRYRCLGGFLYRSQAQPGCVLVVPPLRRELPRPRDISWLIRR